MAKGKKSSMGDREKDQLKAMTRSLRNALKSGTPCCVIVGPLAVAFQK